MGLIPDRIKSIKRLKEEHRKLYMEYSMVEKRLEPIRERYLELMQTWENLNEEQLNELNHLEPQYKALVEESMVLQEKMVEKSQSMNRKRKTYVRAA